MNAGPAAAHVSASEIVLAPGDIPVRVETITRTAQPDAPAIIMVNGALASSRSYRWAIEVLADLNLVLYDLPHADPATSREAGRLITGEDEAAILGFLVARHRPAFLGSMSWGGATALRVLAANPPSVRKAVICSFSDHAGPALRALIGRFTALLEAGDQAGAAALVASTLAARLPDKLKAANQAYLNSLGDGARRYITHHMEEMLQLDAGDFGTALAGVRAEVLFINGADDPYASPADAAALADRLPRGRSAVIADAGHFLALEGPAQAMQLARHLRAFLAAPAAAAPAREAPLLGGAVPKPA